MTPSRILTAIVRNQPDVDTAKDGQRDLWRKFGQSVRASRRRMRIPLKDFSSAIGYTPSMVNMLEIGKRDWTIEKAKLAAGVLK